MGRVGVALTDAKIKKAKAKDKTYKLYDGNNLFLIVNVSGKKVFRVKYKINNRYREISIGEYPFLSLKEARIEAYNIKRMVLSGVDPIEERKKKSSSDVKVKLFEDVVKEFLNLKEQEWRYVYYKKQVGRLDNYILPKLAKRDIKEIEKSDIIEIIKSVKDCRLKNDTKRSDKIEITKRVYMLLRQIFRFALHSDYVDRNIVESIDINSLVAKKEVKHLEAILDIKELRELYRDILQYPNKNVQLALRFLTLSALRPGNVRDLQFSWVDGDIIVIPKEFMKTNKEFRLPLTKSLKEIIEEARELNGESGYIFRSIRSKSSKLSDNTLNSAIKSLGYAHRAHGWRSSFSTICYENIKKHGFSSEVIEMQLAHSVGSAVTRAYMRSDFLEERRKLLEWWEMYLIK